MSDKVWAIAEFVVGVALLLSLVRLLLRRDEVQRITRFITNIFLGGKK
jgi:hypothetical protein